MMVKKMMEGDDKKAACAKKIKENGWCKEAKDQKACFAKKMDWCMKHKKDKKEKDDMEEFLEELKKKKEMMEKMKDMMGGDDKKAACAKKIKEGGWCKDAK